MLDQIVRAAQRAEALVRQILEASSTLSQGTAIRILLPAAPAGATPHAAVAAPAEALETLSADSPHIDVVMSDLAMPKMSGIELTERIRRDHTDIAIVLCSGRVTEEDRERAGRAGISEILATPFASHQLAAVMERSLGATGTRH